MAAAATAEGVMQLAVTMDTWELSLYDSDYDDGWKPKKVDKRPKTILRDEWEEGVLSRLLISQALNNCPARTAYNLVRSFAHHGGAIMAVDVESWDQNHDVRNGLTALAYFTDSPGPVHHRGRHCLGQL